MSRVASDHLQQSLLGRIGTNTVELARLQDQISTGKAASRYSGLDELASQHLNLTAQVRRYDQYEKTHAVAYERMNAQSTSLQSLFDLADDIRTKVSQAMSGGIGDAGQITALADQALSTAVTALNVNVGGTYVFGGIQNDSPPIDISNASTLNPLPPGTLPPENPAYYNGSTEKNTARIDETKTISYGITGNDPAIDSTLRALYRVSTSGGDTEELQKAYAELTDSLTAISDRQGYVGAQMKQMEDIRSRQDEFKLQLDIHISNIEDVDVGQAMVDLTQVQAVLEASYMTMSRLNNLSLLDSIR
jgi:flagellar hook-associated protein 3 FlgL